MDPIHFCSCKQGLSVFVGQSLTLHRYYIQNVTGDIQIRVYKIKKKNFNHSSQFISVNAEKISRKSDVENQEKLRKSRLKQNEGFLIKKSVQ